MQRFEPSIDLDFANSLFEKGCQLNNYFLKNFSALFDEATGHRRNAGIRAGGHLRGHLGFAKLFLRPLRAPKEPSGPHVGLRNPWETPSPSARQIDCILAMDYEQKCLRGL